MKCLIVDDEDLARKLLEKYVSNTKDLTLVHSFSNAMELREFLLTNIVDIIFLDINMPELSGMELVRTLKVKPNIIITTAYNEFALEAFEHNVTDYLPKPFSYERFLKAINKAKERTNKITGLENKFFFVKSGYDIVRLMYDDIQFIEGMREYVKINTTDQKTISLNSLNELEIKLPRDIFIRVHRSYIVNISKIKTVKNNTIIVADIEIPISTTYKIELFKLLGKAGLL